MLTASQTGQPARSRLRFAGAEFTIVQSDGVLTMHVDNGHQAAGVVLSATEGRRLAAALLVLSETYELSEYAEQR